MSQSLAELLERKRKQTNEADKIDWDERRTAYIDTVRQLYEQIKVLLGESVHQVQLVYRPKELTENYIGTYAINDMSMIIGGEQVRFSPRGRNILGADGRVDVIGERGTIPLVYQDDAGWAVVQQRMPKLVLAPLDESILAEVLQTVMRL
jgi:hypothetical protein